MKKTFLFLLIAYSFAAQAQITAYSNATAHNFTSIGGYSYFETVFPNISTQNPYSLSGPSPQNDFRFVASSPQGFIGNGYISTNAPNQPVTLKFTNNNVRKMSCELFAGENIQVTATTNLGNSVSVFGGLNSISNFVGFNVQGENEYITQVVFAAPTGVNTWVSIYEMLIGDNTPQNTALNFDGINDHVAVHNSIGNFNNTDFFTVTCWVKVASAQVSLANTDNAILEKWDGVAGAYPFVIRYLNSGADAGKILARRYDGGTLTATVLISGSSINDGKWHHIAYVKESSGYLKLYIDGALSNSDPDLIQNSTTNISPLYIGSRNNINHFKGEIDEVRIWTVGKTQTEIQNEMFCKNPNATNLQAAFNFNNGSPNNDNRGIISVVNSVNTSLPGLLSNFAKDGDASNWVTGQVKYVKANATGLNNGSSWANAFTDLQSALSANTCNDLFDVYVATGTYKPHASNINISFEIPVGMKTYGGFSGTEKNINERNMALIYSTNKTTLSGDLTSDDTPFNFASNRSDNSNNIAMILGSNVNLDGFKISGATNGALNVSNSVSNIKIQNCMIVDNASGSTGAGISFGRGTTSQIINCKFLGNSSSSGAVKIVSESSSTHNLQNCLFSGNSTGIKVETPYSNTNFNLTNCTLSGNGTAIDEFVGGGATINNNFTNCILHSNTTGIKKVISVGGTINDNITYSLVQGIISGTGNLNGNITNPNFLNPILYTNPTDAGDYRLKWCSLAIGAGTNSVISPLDLDRNPRNFNGTADIGAYEFLGNTPSQVNNSTITGTIDSPTYAGGAIQTIISTAKILAPAGAIDFKVPNSITLNPGFEARGVSKYFQAQIGANVSCSN
ncbi:MAG: LamG-like jellyroll fold domain-containing protein [Spirosomataceae bacterium]